VRKFRAPRRQGLIFVGLLSIWDSLHVTLLALRILRWLLDFWKICAHLTYGAVAPGVHWVPSVAIKYASKYPCRRFEGI
jgi:hypothetical protein